MWILLYAKVFTYLPKVDMGLADCVFSQKGKCSFLEIDTK